MIPFSVSLVRSLIFWDFSESAVDGRLTEALYLAALCAIYGVIITCRSLTNSFRFLFLIALFYKTESGYYK